MDKDALTQSEAEREALKRATDEAIAAAKKALEQAGGGNERRG